MAPTICAEELKFASSITNVKLFTEIGDNTMTMN